MKPLAIISLACISLFVVLIPSGHYEFTGGTALPQPESLQARHMIEREMLITAYAEHGVMASGKWTYKDAIACPRDWPMGRKVEISGKEYTCEDHYNKRLSERLDMWLGDRDEAVNWGVKNLIVKY